MSTYIIRRILLFIPALIGASMLIFVLMRLVPGDIAEILVYQAGSETSGVQQKQIQQIRSELGLERPVPIQYLSWIGGAVRGDFGKSYAQRRPVWDILRERFPRSMELAMLTLAIAVIWTIPLGVISAVHQNGALDRYILTRGDTATVAVAWVEGWFFKDKRLQNFKPGLTTYDNNTFMKVWISQ